MPTLLELQQQRNQLVMQARAILEKAEKEKRDMTAEETAAFDQHMAGSDEKKSEIDKMDAAEGRAKRLKETQADLEKRTGRKVDPDPTDPPPANANPNETVIKFPKRSRAGLLAHHSTREIRIPTVAKTMNSEEGVRGWRNWLRDGRVGEELRSLQVDLDTAGGFLVTPQQFSAELIAIVDDYVFIRQLATVITLTTATTLGVPTRDVDIADSDWTSELATGSEDTALAFGKRELQPHPLAKRIKVSNKLLRAGALDAESIVRDRLAYKFAITQEKAFQTGDGVQKPLGCFIASANGISTGRDVLTGSATNFTADGLIQGKYTLKAQYWPAARWLFHRTAIQKIRQLKDTNGQYLWNPSGIGQASLAPPNDVNAASGIGADLILGFPYMMSEYTPSTFTTGLYVGLLGDFSFYWIVDALSMQLQRLVELYAEKNQTGYIARAELDGAPVLEEPFVRMKTN